VTSISLDFFRQFASSISTGTYASDSSEYSQLTSAIKSFADGFVSVAASYTPSNGGLSEQFDKSSGQPRSAADLTWSYASVLTAAASRAGVKPASWGAEGLIVPSKCVANPGPVITATFNVNATTVFGGMCMLWHASWISSSNDVPREHLPRWIR
jgi:glucoamylase